MSHTHQTTGLQGSIYMMPVHTNLMRPSGLQHGNMAVVDKARKPVLKDLVAVRFNGDVIMRRLDKRQGRWCFVADDLREPILYIRQDDKVERLGVIVDTIPGAQ